MSAQTTTWAQAIAKVLHTSDKEWLSPHEILHQIKCQNLKEICSSAPICSIKKILYKSDGPFIWDKVNHVFALKRRVGDVKVNGQLETPRVDRIKVEQKTVKEEKNTDEAPSKDDTQAEEQPPQEEELSQEEKPPQGEKPPQEDCTTSPQCYNSPLGYVVTISPPLADDNNAAKHHNSRSPPKLSLSPIRHAFTKRMLQSTTTRTTRPHKSKPTKYSPVDKEGRTAVAVMEYDRLFEATGGTFVALLANQFLPRIVDTFVYDPSQSEESNEPRPSSDSKDMEVVVDVEGSSSKGDGEEGESRSDKAVKKTPPPVAKQKRTRKISDDSNLASVNIRSSLTMENFNKLSKESKQKVINLLPVIDRYDEYTPTSSAFNNTFFNSACRQWQQLLQSGQLSISQRAKQKMEDTSRNKMVDEWKQKHFEEELSKDTPPQDPRSKLFYPIPLNSTRQRVLDCIKRVCKNSHDVDNDSSVTSVNEEEKQKTPDKLLEENKAINIGSPELCNTSHDTNDEPHNVLPEKNHQQDLQPQLNDSKVDHKLLLELNKLSDKNSPPQNSEISEQVSNTTPKKSSELLESNKSSPGTPFINIKLFGRSPEQVGRSPEQVGRSPDQVGGSHDQVGRSHDQACVSPVDTKDKGKQLEQDGKLQDIEKASLSLKLQINKLCQQELYKKLELFNKSAEQQANKLLEAVMTTNEDKPCGISKSRNHSNFSTRCKKKANKPCIKLSMNRSLPAALPKCRTSSINLCLTNNTPSLTKNRISLPSSWLKSPSIFGFNTPLKYESGLKRKLPPTMDSPTNAKKNCDDTRGDFLTNLPEAFMYSDIVAELKRRSVGNFFIATSSCRGPTKDWQSLHSIYHDHSYATDYVPINSTASEGQLAATVCDGCMEVPLVMCMNCNRCFHDWCMLQGCSCCEDCCDTDVALPLV